MEVKESIPIKIYESRGSEKRQIITNRVIFWHQEYSGMRPGMITIIIHSVRLIHTEGDYNEKWKSYIFKIVCEGISGDDGNLYRYFLSRDANTDLPIEGANAFTYEYTFRMWNDTKSIAHIYPYVDTGIVSIKQEILTGMTTGRFWLFQLINREFRFRYPMKMTGRISTIPVEQAEIGKSLDFQFHKKQELSCKK